MNRKTLCAAAAWLLVACSGAWAGASATVTLDGVTASMDGSGASATPVGIYDATLGPGQSESFDFTYSATVQDSGLPATRDWQFCTPLFETYCGPDPTGSEQAEAYIAIGADLRSNPGAQFFDIEGLRELFFDAPAGGGATTESGSFTVTVTNTSTFYVGDVSFYALEADFVDAAPVPEPAVPALLLAGLVTCGLRRMRGARAAGAA